MELSEYDPYRAIGGHTPFSKFMIRQRGEPTEAWMPVMEAFHTYDEMVLRYEIAGVAPSDIDVRVDGRVLYVHGVRRRADELPEELTMRDERGYGPFERSVALPEGVLASQVRASYQYGVLEIRIAHNQRPQATVVQPDVLDNDPVEVEVNGTCQPE
jgi:HSP20 family protein